MSDNAPSPDERPDGTPVPASEPASAADPAPAPAADPEPTPHPVSLTGKGVPRPTPKVTKYPGGPAADPAGSHHERRIRSFQPRRSRVTPAQADALKRLWPVWGHDIDGRGLLDLDKLFEGRPVILEIGFGMGEATAQMAEADPDTGILAADVHTPGQGNLLRLIETKGLTNLRVANGDAIILLREMLPPSCLAGIRVFFPDPWPKKRHHKRRIIQPEFLDLAASRMAPDAVLHCATDWEPYAEHMLETLTADPRFENLHGGRWFAPRPDFRPRTRFEGQGLGKGHVVRDLLFRRVS